MFLYQSNTAMSVVRLFELLLPEDAVYLAGSSIKGQVVLLLGRALLHPTVKVELVGRGYMHWTEDIWAPCCYRRDEVLKTDYVHQRKTWPARGDWLSAGCHIFDFHFELPPRIPSTFQSNVGHISFHVRAWCMNKENILARTRIQVMIQGTSDPLQNPVVAEARKTVCYNCFRQGTICLRIEMEKNTFTPGERVTFSTEIHNQTGKCIRNFTSVLYIHTRYEGFMHTDKRRSRLYSSEPVQQKEVNTRVEPFSTIELAGAFNLPRVMPVSSNAQVGELMSFRYELVGTIHVPWSLARLTARLPITITSPPMDTDI